MAAEDEILDGVLTGLLERPMDSELARVLPPHTIMRSVSARQAIYRPGRRLTVTYEVPTRQGGLELTELIVVTTAVDELPEDIATTSVAGRPVALFRAPEDPRLPGLSQALDRDHALELLRAAGHRATEASAVIVAYRPRSRAVVEVRATAVEHPKLVFSRGTGIIREEAPQAALYLKVFRPRPAARVAAMHAQIEPWLPIPRCTQISEDGILLFGALPGVDLYDALVDGAPEPPAPSAIIDVLDRLPEFEDPPELWSSDEMVEDYRELISALVPEHASLVDRLAEALTRAEQQPVVPIHGDFHEGNILLDRSGISGVLDVDDAGYGERVEDLGLLLGRVWALGMTSGEASILEYADRLLREFSEQVDPLELRRRAGVAVLGRATSPFRNQMRDWRRRTVDRLELAEQWIEASGLAR